MNHRCIISEFTKQKKPKKDRVLVEDCSCHNRHSLFLSSPLSELDFRLSPSLRERELSREKCFEDS